MEVKNKKLINRVLIAVTVVLPLLLINFGFDSDTYWIIKTGEYICNNGIPVKDFLTIHTDMDLVVQQWLADVIYYLSFKAFGVCGPMLIVYFCYGATTFLLYKFCNILSNRKFVMIFFVYMAVAFMSRMSLVARPQIFTYCIVLTELICLESCVKKQNYKYLFAIPILSVLLVNLHASMWTMLLIFMLPYIVNALPIKINGKNLSCCRLTPLLICAVMVVVCGFLSPYGYKGLMFIFTASVGNKVNSSIDELSPLSLSADINSIAVLSILLIIIAIYLLNKGGKTTLRYMLLTLGTGLMMLMYVKLTPYFIIVAYPVALSYVDNVNFKGLIKAKGNDNSKLNPKTAKVLVILIISFTVMLMGCIFINFGADIVSTVKNNAADAETVEIDAAMEIAEKDAAQNNTEIVLFNGFNSGGYLEFKGYKTYIDARADSFVVEANNDYDYLTEYESFVNGRIYYKTVIDKYGFTYLLVDNYSEKPLNTSLSRDSEYTVLYEGELYTLYKTEKSS